MLIDGPFCGLLNRLWLAAKANIQIQGQTNLLITQSAQSSQSACKVQTNKARRALFKNNIQVIFWDKQSPSMKAANSSWCHKLDLKPANKHKHNEGTSGIHQLVINSLNQFQWFCINLKTIKPMLKVFNSFAWTSIVFAYSIDTLLFSREYLKIRLNKSHKVIKLICRVGV